MKRRCRQLGTLLVLALFTSSAQAQESTAFTYQGRLLEQNVPAEGDYDFRFALYDSDTEGTRMAGPLILTSVPVKEGVFTVIIDFGVPLTLEGRWLAIEVRPFGLEIFAPLETRQELTPAPFAITAATVSPGAITSEMLAPGAVTTDKIAAGAITGEQLDDEGRSGYEAFAASVEVFQAGTPLPFEQLSPMTSLGGPAPSITLEIDGSPVGEVIGFVGSEAISQPFAFAVQLQSPTALGDPTAYIRLPATLTLERNGRTTRFEGQITAMTLGSAERTKFITSIRIEPALSDLALSTDYQISQETTVGDLVKSYYEVSTGELIEQRLNGSYESHENLIQYAETDLDFVSRLLEHEGIFYCFDTGSSPPTLVLGDHAGAYALGSGLSLEYFGNTATSVPTGAEFVRTFKRGTAQATAIATIDSRDFTRPATSLLRTSVSTSGRSEGFEYGTDVALEGYVQQLADLRRFRYDLERQVLAGTATSPDLRAAHVFRLEDLTGAGLEGDYVVTAVRHAGFVREVKGVRTVHYGNVFEVIPAHMTFIPRRSTPRPQALPCTAVVTGPGGEEIHVDEYGRVKVQFHWDRAGQTDEYSSAWLRVVSPMAGQNHSILFLPHIGDEVLVTFIQGDPDRPVILGSLHNANAMPPYELPSQKTRSTIRSRGPTGQVNELRFEDAIGSQELFLNAAKDMTVVVENDLNETTAHNRTVAVGNDLNATLGNEVSVSVGNALNVEVSGPTTFSSVQTVVSGAVTLGGPVQLNSITSPDLQVDGPLTVTGAVSADSSLSVEGTLAANGTLTANESLSVGRGTKLGMVQAGQEPIPASVSQTATVTITFPRRFSTTPKVVVTVNGNPKSGLSELFTANVRTASTLTCTVNIAHLGTGGWTQPLGLNWIAWE